MSARERRKHRRAHDKNIVLVTLLAVPGQQDHEGRTFTCTTADVSIGGIRLISSVNVPLGTVMDLRVAAVSPPSAFKFKGRVNWKLEVSSPPAFFVGIEFTESDKETAAAWSKFVEQKVPKPLSTDDIDVP